MLSVLMLLLDAALPLAGPRPTYYTHGAITPTGASRGGMRRVCDYATAAAIC